MGQGILMNNVGGGYGDIIGNDSQISELTNLMVGEKYIGTLVQATKNIDDLFVSGATILDSSYVTYVTSKANLTWYIFLIVFKATDITATLYNREIYLNYLKIN